MNWLILASPFLLAAAILGVIKGCELYAKWQERRRMRRRDEKLRLLNLTPFRGTRSIHHGE